MCATKLHLEGTALAYNVKNVVVLKIEQALPFVQTYQSVIYN